MAAKRVLDADRKRRGETKEETERKMKKKMEEEQERMEEINRKNREEMARDKERAAEKLRKMEARARGERVEEEELEEFGVCGDNEDVLVLHPQPSEFFEGFGKPLSVDVRLLDAQRVFQQSDKQKQVLLGPFRERGDWNKSPLPQRERKEKGKGKGKGKGGSQEEREKEKEEERDREIDR